MIRVLSTVFLFAVTVLSASAQLLQPLSQYTGCKWDSKFQTVQTDRLPEAMGRTINTKSGEKTVQLLDGYRVLITYLEVEPFVNLKVEQLSAPTYVADKQALIDYLGVVAAGSQGMQSNSPVHSQASVFDVYGIDRKELTGGVLSIYELFNDADNTVTTIYFLNAEPVERKFHTPEEFYKLRDDFLKQYGKCLQPEPAPALANPRNISGTDEGELSSLLPSADR